MGKRGPKHTYKPQLGRKICDELASGRTLRAVCRDEGMPDEVTVRRWALDDLEGFGKLYTKAREIAYLGMGDDIVEIADTETDANKARNRIQARQWTVSRILPKVYGDKIQADMSGQVTVNIAADDKKLL